MKYYWLYILERFGEYEFSAKCMFSVASNDSKVGLVCAEYLAATFRYDAEAADLTELGGWYTTGDVGARLLESREIPAEHFKLLKDNNYMTDLTGHIPEEFLAIVLKNET